MPGAFILMERTFCPKVCSYLCLNKKPLFYNKGKYHRSNSKQSQ